MENEINVLIHGFAGTVDEILYLKDFLDKKGINTYALKLSGHDGTKKGLHKSSHKDWVKSAEEEVAKLCESYEKVNLIGFSMGGLICIGLSRIFKVNKLVLINAPVYIWNFKIIARRVFGDLFGGGMENISYYWYNIFRVSLKSCVSFLRLLRKSNKTLETGQADTIILQCMDDELVHYKSAQYLKNKLGEKAILRYYEGGRHQIFVVAPELMDIFCDEIFGFISD
ncbi:MAG: alpha/beta fold hydrolase [Defluviitaleaceae bacterium]|nr:alpha/beta fold hydrolase [Defluviitaleaceae bacterium]